VVAANSANYQAVDQCRERVFLARELCLAESCGKPGTRNHPLCVKHREEVRLREESKVRQGPQ
jgi:serine/threonine-protein kinase